ncbi:MAG: HDOD domain-containing protein [Leptospiraceae bacterium]|nr:HDOD domain-containing protein [Leptospiraceae bacterium]
MPAETHIPLGTNPDTQKPYSSIIVDEGSIDRSLLRRFLQSEKFDIINESSNAEDVLNFLVNSSKIPDLVCIDLHLPGPKNGVDVIKEINQSYPTIKIIVISAVEDRSLIQSLLNLKIHAFLRKPYSRAAISDRFAKVFGRAGSLSSTDATAKTIHLADLEIPPLPMVAIKIMSFDTDNPAGGSEELEKLIGPDKAITTDIMKIANSAYYGRSGKIHSLREAITLLGMKTVKNLVMLKSKKQFSKNLSGEVYHKHLEELPVLTALIGFDLTNPLGLKKIREDVFLAGLLRKIGMTVLALNFPTRYSELLDLSSTGTRDLLLAETENFKINHIEAGTKIFKIWKMPPHLQQIVNHQDFTPDAVEMVSDVDRISRLAGILATKMLGFKLPDYEARIEHTLFHSCNFSPELQEAFGEDYYDMIKDHPFFEMMA